MSNISFKSAIIVDNFNYSTDNTGFAIADFNHDGLADVIRGGPSESINISYQKSDGSFSPSSILIAANNADFGRNSFDISVIDVDGDGSLDIVDIGSSQAGSSIIINYGNGSNQFTSTKFHTNNDYGGGTSFADLDGDGKLDIASVGIYSPITMLTTGPFAAYYSNGNGSGGIGVYYPGGELRNSGEISNNLNSSAGVFADITGDGIPDFVVSETSNQTVAVYEGVRRAIAPGTIPTGGQPFRAGDLGGATRYSVSGGAADVAVADLDHDGRTDIVTVNVNASSGRPAYDISILMNKGGGKLEHHGISMPDDYGPSGGWYGDHSLELGDINNDGNVDIVAIGRNSCAWAFLGQGNGEFDPGIAIPLGASPDKIKLADVNGDGLLDLITGNGSVQIYLNNTQVGPQKADMLETAGIEVIKTVAEFESYDRILTFDQNDLLTDQVLLRISDAGTLNLSSRLEGVRGATVYASNDGNTIIAGDKNDYLYGGHGNDILDGSAGVDRLDGGSGNDTYYVDNTGDQVTEAVGAGNDTVYASVSYTLKAGQEIETLRGSGSVGLTLTGNEFANKIVGGGGNDILNGKAGPDALFGGLGDDSYYVDNVADLVTEALRGGNDTVYASVGYTLKAGQEIETLRALGSTGLSLTGNEFANKIVGGAGNDILNGKAGADALFGGLGDDAYYVDNAGDQVTEAVGAGNDTVYASVGYTLKAGQEIETLRSVGSTGISLTGNEFANKIVGGTGNDILNGKGGADALFGGAGDDTYYVDNTADQVTEAAGDGNDTIYTSVSYTLKAGQEIEILRAVGSTGLTLTGNAGSNTIIGGGGGDVLIGGLGSDTMTGGAGSDTFVFRTLGDSGYGTSNRDAILDFKVGIDHVDLSALQAVLGVATDQSFTFLGDGPFTKHAGELHAIQSNGSTIIEGDIDGNGKADFQIVLRSMADALHASDFIL